jgi:predicted enzyme related to lactoylglutathione lyase
VTVDAERQAGVVWQKSAAGANDEEGSMSNRVVHFEIPYDDAERASTFYGETFGWDMTPMPEMGYVMVGTGPNGDQGPTEPGFINGGMLQRQGEWTAPNLVIDVANLEEALTSVEEHGGKTVVERQPVGDMGFTAYFRDSEGNLVGLWETVRSG